MVKTGKAWAKMTTLARIQIKHGWHYKYGSGLGEQLDIEQLLQLLSKTEVVQSISRNIEDQNYVTIKVLSNNVEAYGNRVVVKDEADNLIKLYGDRVSVIIG